MKTKFNLAIFIEVKELNIFKSQNILSSYTQYMLTTIILTMHKGGGIFIGMTTQWKFRSLSIGISLTLLAMSNNNSTFALHLNANNKMKSAHSLSSNTKKMPSTPKHMERQ